MRSVNFTHFFSISRFSTCKLRVLDEEKKNLKGGVTLNFDLLDHVWVKNQIKVMFKNGREEDQEFITRFKFSSKAKLVVPLCSQNTGKNTFLKTANNEFK